MRIWLFCVSDVFGGGERFTLKLAAALSEVVDITVLGVAASPILYAAETRGLKTEAVDIGAKLGRRSAAANLLRARRFARNFDAFAAELDSDDWCVYQYKWEQLLSRRQRRGRVAMLEHATLPTVMKRARPLVRRLKSAYRTADVVFAVSESARRDLEQFEVAPTMLFAGVDRERVTHAILQAPQMRRDLAIPNGTFLFVFSGRVERAKGIIEAISAIGKVAGTALLVIGEGSALAEARKHAARVAPDRVIFHERVEDVLPFLAASDALVLFPHGAEGRPLSVVEAAAVGTPTLGVSTSWALRDLMADGLPVVLLDEVNPGTVTAALPHLKSMRGVRPELPSWLDVAGRFVECLSSSVGSSALVRTGGGSQ